MIEIKYGVDGKGENNHLRNQFHLQQKTPSREQRYSRKKRDKRRKPVKHRRKSMFAGLLCVLAIFIGGWIILTMTGSPADNQKVQTGPAPAIAEHPEEPDDSIAPGPEDWWDPADPSITPDKKTTPKDGKKPVISAPPTTSSQHILHNNWRNPDLNRLPTTGDRANNVLPSVPPLSHPSMQQAPSVKPPNRKLQIAVRVPYWDSVATERLEQVADQIDELNFPWYDIHSNGTLTLRKADKAGPVLKMAEKNKIRLLPIIGNQYSSALLHEILNQPQKRTQLIKEIAHTVEKQGYSGIELQFEPILEEDRDSFSLFVEELSEQLHEQQHWLSVALQPKGDSKQDPSSGQDWKRISEAADSVKIMAYHYSLKQPGPGAPIPWLENTLKQAKADIPSNKIYVSLSAQGYLWTGPDQLAPLTFKEAQDLIHVHQASPQREGDQPWFQYSAGKQTHTVYYQDAVGYRQKMNFLLKQDPDLAGIAHWYLGAEDPDTWKVIRETNKKDR